MYVPSFVWLCFEFGNELNRLLREYEPNSLIKLNGFWRRTVAGPRAGGGPEFDRSRPIP